MITFSRVNSYNGLPILRLGSSTTIVNSEKVTHGVDDPHRITQSIRRTAIAQT